jgi:hypothetical protein
LEAPETQPGRRIALAAALGVFIGVLLAGLAQTLGGGSSLAAQISAESRRLAADNRRLSQELNRLRIDMDVDREAYGQVEKQLAELQDKILEQQEEVAFYRGVVGGAGEGGVQVKDLTIQPAADGRYALAFVVAQIETAEREVQGQIQLRIEGERASRTVSVDAASLASAAARKALTFRFRYFTEVSLELALPAGLKPQRVVVRVLPATRGVRTSVASFPWVTSGS